MPPKIKFTKEEIIEAAYDLARERGIDAVVAREVGKRLGTSSSPIFTVWNSMDELRAEVLAKAQRRFLEYTGDIFDYSPAFKMFGMRWVEFAATEPHLYRLLFLSGKNDQDPYVLLKRDFADIFTPLIKEVQLVFGLSAKSAEDLIETMVLFTNGISTFLISDPECMSKESISRDISRVCIGIVIAEKLSSGELSHEGAQALISNFSSGVTPQKRSQKENGLFDFSCENDAARSDK